MSVEEDAFREAMSDVAPLKDSPRRAGSERPALDPTPAQLERQRAALGLNERSPAVDPNPLTLGEVRPLDPREILAWKKDGVQHEVFSRLKAGKYDIEGSLDLHRLTVKESRAKVYEFFRLAAAKGWRTLLISHGRGERSSTPARIKSYVAHWLGQLPEVIAFHSAERRHGGTGAVYVLLRKSAAAKELTREQFGHKSSEEGR
jgi:DNA-nicking Smr family endonuclease